MEVVTIAGFKIKNINVFKNFLSEKLQKEVDLKASIEELLQQHGNTGIEEYELSQHETATGRTESISFEIDCNNMIIEF